MFDNRCARATLNIVGRGSRVAWRTLVYIHALETDLSLSSMSARQYLVSNDILHFATHIEQ